MNESPRITFPCAYPIRVIGDTSVDLRTTVLRIVREHAPDLDEATVSVRESRAGGYCSVRFSIVATGESQLRALHGALMAEQSVRLVL